MKYIYFKTLLNPQRFTFEEELSSKRVGKFLPPAISFSKILYNIILESVRNSRISHFHYKNPTNEINHSIRSPRKRATINFLPRPPFFFFENREGLGSFLKNSSTEKSRWPLHGPTPINYTPLLSRCLIKSANESRNSSIFSRISTPRN